MLAPADARPRVEPRDVARAIAQQRQRLLGQRRDDELAAGARRQRAAGLRVDRLEEKMVLPAVQPGARLQAFAGDARPEDLREPVDVDRGDAEPRLELRAHRLAPRLGAEHADAQRAAFEIDAVALGDLGDVEGVGGRRAEHRGGEILQQPICRSVLPPDIGTTVQPRRSAP